MVEATRQPPLIPAAEWLKALPPTTRFVFHGNAAARTAAAAAWGVPFSEIACRAHTAGGRATLWMGPDEYLLLDPPATAAADASALFAAIETATASVPHALVDVSHRQITLELTGPHAATILAGACPLDLDLAEFPIDMCTRTVLAKADIVLWRTHSDTFRIEAWRSFAGYVTGLLREIAAEFYSS